MQNTVLNKVAAQSATQDTMPQMMQFSLWEKLCVMQYVSVQCDICRAFVSEIALNQIKYPVDVSLHV